MQYCDKRVMNGYDSLLLYKEANESKYHLLIPLETVPTVSGSVDTFDFDLLSCPSKGQVEGKESLDQVDVDYLWHRDNVMRLEALQGRVLDFMAIYQDFTARTFSGTIKVRPQEAGADIMRGTFTITPMSATSTTILDARDLVQDTVVFVNNIPSNLSMASNSEKLEIKTLPSAGVSLKVESNNESFKGEIIGGELTISYLGDGSTKEYAVLTITASAPEYASWTTTIAVENSGE